MAFTSDPTTETGFIRLLITDTDPTSPIFSDEQIAAFRNAEPTVKQTAALALETIARNELLVLKVIKNLQLTTDGAKVSAELRAHAKELRAQAESDTASGDATFDIAEWSVDQFAARHIRRAASWRAAE